jgi:3-oxoacyl-[acyl-carrier protein] reductase
MVAASTQGIGWAIAEALADEGCSVSICGRTNETVSERLQDLGPGHFGLTCDVTKTDDLRQWHEATVNALGAPSILVTNTGGPPAGAIDEKTWDEWQIGIDSTLKNVVTLSELCAPEMEKAEWGRIVHITSLVAMEPSPVLAISSTLRAGLMAYVRLQAARYARSGITVNAVLPGHTRTARQVHLAEVIAQREGISADEALLRRGASTGLGRLAEAE